MKIIKVIAVAISAFFLVSCGGGSSSGGGGDLGAENGADLGAENGAETVTHSGPKAHPAANGTFPLRIVHTENTVTIGHISNDETATLASDGSFTLTLNRTFWDISIKQCKILTTYSGKVEGTLVTGTVSSDGPCVYKTSLRIPHEVTGTFTSAP
jgi:hypothetical protein